MAAFKIIWKLRNEPEEKILQRKKHKGLKRRGARSWLIQNF